MVAGRVAGFRLRSVCAAALGALMLAGCGSGITVGKSGSNPLQTVQVSISGASTVRVGATTQFSATVTNTSNTAVSWQVNGIAGGSSGVGTISASGLYTPPAMVPTTNTVTITAVSQAQSSASGSAPESILNPLPVLSSATANNSSGTSYVVTATGSGFVSGSVMQVLGANVSTTFVSSTALTATVTIAAGIPSVAVDVVNPNPGGSTSGSVNATISSTSVAAAARILDAVNWTVCVPGGDFCGADDGTAGHRQPGSELLRHGGVSVRRVHVVAGGADRERSVAAACGVCAERDVRGLQRERQRLCDHAVSQHAGE